MLTRRKRDTNQNGKSAAGEPSQLSAQRRRGAVDILAAPPRVRSKLKSILIEMSQLYGVSYDDMVSGEDKSRRIGVAKSDAMALAANLKDEDGKSLASIAELCTAFGVTRAWFNRTRAASPYFQSRYRRH